MRQADLHGALSFLREAEAVSGPDPFPAELLDRLRALVRAELANFCELDRPGRRLISSTESTGERTQDDPENEEQQAFWRLRHELPHCAYQDRTGDFSARKVSDFLTRRELHRLELYVDYWRPAGVEFQILVGLPAPPWHTKVFLFHSSRADFQERDRQLLDLLRPHLVHLHESAAARRLAAALAAGAEAPGHVIVLDSADRIDYASPSARRLLGEYCDDARGTRLPLAIEEWLALDRGRLNGDSLPARGKPLEIYAAQRRLVVNRLNGDGRALLLTEDAAPATAKLSWREWQVLALVEEGKSNAEIAATLWIAHGTVRTHLEHIYAKLGVRSRTAALARVRSLKAAEHGSAVG